MAHVKRFVVTEITSQIAVLRASPPQAPAVAGRRVRSLAGGPLPGKL